MKLFKVILSLCAVLMLSSCNRVTYEQLGRHFLVGTDRHGNKGLYARNQELLPPVYKDIILTDDNVGSAYFVARNDDVAEVYFYTAGFVRQLYSAPKIEPCRIHPVEGNEYIYIGTFADGKQEGYCRFYKDVKTGRHDAVYPGIWDMIYRDGDKWGLITVRGVKVEPKYDQVYAFACYGTYYALGHDGRYDLYEYGGKKLARLGTTLTEAEIKAIQQYADDIYSPYSFLSKPSSLPDDVYNKVKGRLKIPRSMDIKRADIIRLRAERAQNE